MEETSTNGNNMRIIFLLGISKLEIYNLLFYPPLFFSFDFCEHLLLVCVARVCTTRGYFCYCLL